MIVREHIEFERNLDPLDAMGAGKAFDIFKEHEFQTHEEVADFIYKNLKTILGYNIPDNIINHHELYMDDECFHKIKEYARDYIKINLYGEADTNSWFYDLIVKLYKNGYKESKIAKELITSPK